MTTHTINWQRWLLTAFGLLFITIGIVGPVAAQDAVSEITERMTGTEVSFINPFNGEGVTVTVFRVLYVVAGALLLFAGWWAYRWALAVIGFAIGAQFGVAVAANAGFNPLLTLVTSLLVGVAFSMLAIFAYFIAVLVFGAYVGALLTGNLLLWLDVAQGAPNYTIFVVIGAVIGGLIALALAFELVVVLTAYLGAVMLTSALNLNAIWWVVGLFLLGVAVQAGIGRTRNEEVFQRRRVVRRRAA